MTYQCAKILIENGRYEYDDMFAMLDLFLMMHRISYEQYIELTGMMAPDGAEEAPEEVPEEAVEE